MSEHTPGPWEASGPEVLQSEDQTRHVATAWNHDKIDPDGSEANARLIAAAPDLLAACEALVALYDESPSDFFCVDDTQLAAARAAIARAKGGAS